MIVVGVVLLNIYVFAAATKPRSVNLALETVLEFNRETDTQVIDKLQEFLGHIKRVIDKRTSKQVGNNVQFTDFLKKSISVLQSYNDDDLEDFFEVFQEEVKNYYYKGCKFHEIMENRSLRRLMSDKLDKMLHIPLKTVKEYLQTLAFMLQRRPLDKEKEKKKFLNYVNSIYDAKAESKYKTFLYELKTYKRRSRRTLQDLKNIVRNGLRSIIFDHYSNLNDTTRLELKLRIEWFWRIYLKPNHIEHSMKEIKTSTALAYEKKLKGKHYKKQQKIENTDNVRESNLHKIKFNFDNKNYIRTNVKRGKIEERITNVSKIWDSHVTPFKRDKIQMRESKRTKHELKDVINKHYNVPSDAAGNVDKMRDSDSEYVRDTETILDRTRGITRMNRKDTNINITPKKTKELSTITETSKSQRTKQIKINNSKTEGIYSYDEVVNKHFTTKPKPSKTTKFVKILTLYPEEINKLQMKVSTPQTRIQTLWTGDENKRSYTVESESVKDEDSITSEAKETDELVAEHSSVIKVKSTGKPNTKSGFKNNQAKGFRNKPRVPDNGYRIKPKKLKEIKQKRAFRKSNDGPETANETIRLVSTTTNAASTSTKSFSKLIADLEKQLSEAKIRLKENKSSNNHNSTEDFKANEVHTYEPLDFWEGTTKYNSITKMIKKETANRENNTTKVDEDSTKMGGKITNSFQNNTIEVMTKTQTTEKNSLKSTETVNLLDKPILRSFNNTLRLGEINNKMQEKVKNKKNKLENETNYVTGTKERSVTAVTKNVIVVTHYTKINTTDKASDTMEKELERIKTKHNITTSLSTTRKPFDIQTFLNETNSYTTDNKKKKMIEEKIKKDMEILFAKPSITPADTIILNDSEDPFKDLDQAIGLA